MEIIGMRPVSRKNANEPTKNQNFLDESYLDKIANLDKKIVMSATAKRKPLKGSFNVHSEGDNARQELKNFQFFKLQAPSRPKRFHQENKLISRNCEILFECMRPVRRISTRKNLQNLEPTSVTRSILKSNNLIMLERKAKRKVQFLSFCEEKDPLPFMFSKEEFKSNQEPANEVEMYGANVQKPDNIEVPENSSPTSRKLQKTISSNDFINTVFSPL